MSVFGATSPSDPADRWPSAPPAPYFSIVWVFLAFYHLLHKTGAVPVAREQRKLAAIVAANVVDYSRLMGRDESGTLARIRNEPL